MSVVHLVNKKDMSVVHLVNQKDMSVVHLVNQKDMTVVHLVNQIIIIIKRDWQCKAGRERSTPYQSEDPNPTTPTLEIKKRKGKQ